MFRQTLARAADRTRFSAPIVVCGDAHVAHVEADLMAAGIVDARIIVEPAARSTAPAIALAALALDPQSMLLVMPSDHDMTDVSEFLDAIAATAPPVEDGALALFGIAPARPATGYGSIAAGALPSDDGTSGV